MLMIATCTHVHRTGRASPFRKCEDNTRESQRTPQTETADPCRGCISHLKFSLCCTMKVQHCKSRGVLNKNAGSGSSGCISVRSCRSAARERGQDLWTMCNLKSPGLDGPSAVCGGHGRSVFAATCLAMSRFLATYGQCSAALHTCVERVRAGRQTGRLSLCRTQKTNTSRRPPSALIQFTRVLDVVDVSKSIR